MPIYVAFKSLYDLVLMSDEKLRLYTRDPHAKTVERELLERSLRNAGLIGRTIETTSVAPSKMSLTASAAEATTLLIMRSKISPRRNFPDAPLAGLVDHRVSTTVE